MEAFRKQRRVEAASEVPGRMRAASSGMDRSRTGRSSFGTDPLPAQTGSKAFEVSCLGLRSSLDRKVGLEPETVGSLGQVDSCFLELHFVAT